MQFKACHSFQNHKRNGVCCVLPGFRNEAADSSMLTKVPYACGLLRLAKAAAIKSVDFEEECIDKFLRLIHCDSAFFKVFLQVGPCILVKSAQTCYAGIVINFKENIVHHYLLAGFPEGTCRLL